MHLMSLQEENESVPQTAPVVAEVEDEAGAQKPEYPAVPGGGDRGVHVKWPKKVGKRGRNKSKM